jgi:ribosomal protein L37AE/L43A
MTGERRLGGANKCPDCGGDIVRREESTDVTPYYCWYACEKCGKKLAEGVDNG